MADNDLTRTFMSFNDRDVDSRLSTDEGLGSHVVWEYGRYLADCVVEKASNGDRGRIRGRCRPCDHLNARGGVVTAGFDSIVLRRQVVEDDLHEQYDPSLLSKMVNLGGFCPTRCPLSSVCKWSRLFLERSWQNLCIILELIYCTRAGGF